ncbi:hypothetical protein J437_LFUL016942 [Ladona fulva]|uniref:Uncharacterized protein n=1 Tax=Ladona fulva TaxID=123851 RepID=A0A8K0KKL6_LADFU|nr:hypothetical protein J437_LFUL016942 [Ladona fulva]
MNEEDYTEKCLNFISDEGIVPLHRDPTASFQKNIKAALSQRSNIPHREFFKCTVMNPTSPRFFGLPKIHKPATHIRLVVSSINSPSELKTTTKGKDFMEMISTFFESNGLQCKNLCGVCTDGAPAMLGSRSGFQTKVKELAPQAKGMHCIIHRFALATKTLPKPLQEVLDSLVTIVNYIKSSALNTRLFKEL